jgi:hypothetical protein
VEMKLFSLSISSLCSLSLSFSFSLTHTAYVCVHKHTCTYLPNGRIKTTNKRKMCLFRWLAQLYRWIICLQKHLPLPSGPLTYNFVHFSISATVTTRTQFQNTYLVIAMSTSIHNSSILIVCSMCVSSTF